MKFAKELEQDCVPEWRAMYLDYKGGKKRVKSVSRAISRANGTPRSFVQSQRIFKDSPFFAGTSPLSRRFTATDRSEPGNLLRESPAAFGSDSRPGSDESSNNRQTVTTPILMPKQARPMPSSDTNLQYGSFVKTPPQAKPTTLQLPDPAISPDVERLRSVGSRAPAGLPSQTTMDDLQIDGGGVLDHAAENAYEVGRTVPPPHRSTFGSLRGRGHELQRHTSTPGARNSGRPLLRRIFSTAVPSSKSDLKRVDYSLETLGQVRTAERSFFEWMDKELDKIETFYRSKEEEAGERLKVLREQLHEMRNRRIDEIAETKKAREIRKHDERTALDRFGLGDRRNPDGGNNHDDSKIQNQLHAWMEPIERIIGSAQSSTVRTRLVSDQKASRGTPKTPDIPQNNSRDPGRDYIRRPHDNEVPYRSAKRKLKLALKEFYRGLELLKSYALLNRTGFRKINKKYDKAVNAHPPLRYMSEKVNKAWFVQSNVLEGHIHATEDLYARYFERGDYKVAVGKLRTPSGRPGEYTASAFRSGILIGTGAVFAIQGVIYATDIEHHHPDPAVRTQTSYLLQIYAGYFLALYLFSLFCVDCSIWTINKINYVFIFEFDPRHHLDWRQLSEFPAFLSLIFGLFMWVNFSRYGAEVLYIYYPVILIFLTALIIFFPAPTLFHRSRSWFVYSHWRLLLAGLYPVEFRDFFLGDMFCSLTYFMSNLELFFCLYAQHPPWNSPAQCNSTHSRLLGFFGTVPGIWRAVQCLRRYYDTRAAFPHLANFGKYTTTIIYYMTLSLYRIHNSETLLGIFITFAAINAVYSSIWDLLMDWSLLQPQAKRHFLRDVRGYKNPWFYYLAMVVDVVLRFNWIFYIIYTHDLQHSSVANFFIAFSEVTRRGMWTLFRVENEHCANVARFKASRDIPLPYKLDPSPAESMERECEEGISESASQATQPSPTLSRHRSRTTAAEAGEASPSDTMRYRGPARTLTKIVADAHTQDFEKKRKPGIVDSDNAKNLLRDTSDEERRINSSDDDEDEQDVLESMEAADLKKNANR